jgi:hypothetical protein
MALNRTESLTVTDMEDFGCWLSMDLAERAGLRGRRQKQPMVGMFITWCVPCPARFRGSDFSLRVALLVHGWRKTGLPILEAAEKVALEYEFVKRRLGKRGRPSEWSQGATEKDETVRTTYYKFVKRYPEIDVLLEMWWWHYWNWYKWVISVDERGIDMATLLSGWRAGHD